MPTPLARSGAPEESQILFDGASSRDRERRRISASGSSLMAKRATASPPGSRDAKGLA